MRNTLTKVLCFVLLLFFLDFIIGAVCKKLYNKSNDFYISKLRHAIKFTNENVLIYGSSRAESHFIPEIIETKTGFTSYNCGFGGADLNFSKLLLNESLKRYTPKFIVVEVSPSAFFIPNADDSRKLLIPYYKNDTLIYNSITKNKFFEKIKFASSIYPYNSNIASLMKGVFKDVTHSLKGYDPSYGLIDTFGLSSKISKTYSSPLIPSDMFVLFTNFISFCKNKGIKIIIVSTPVFKANKNHDLMIEQISATCRKSPDCYFLDFSQYSSTYNNPNLFKDNTHLNDKGAKIFSEAFSDIFLQIAKGGFKN